ncbi:MAG TPA: class I SAM-dependent methyltransferase [Planctomycetota bacterium]|nr:class I SAM-dependent methyltransferase [Planctomycetota bacterium]
MPSTIANAPDHSSQMDRIYRVQRHFYDLTRKFYLFGRDRLIRTMDIRPGMNVLEIGCGTARNLILLARKHPQARFYGLDASREMLATAQKKIDSRKLADRITLKYCLAEELDYKRTFELNEKFDAMFFSYSLSMIPTWRAALDAAFANVKPGHSIYSVDFWDQRELPAVFRKMLVWWLSLFHVHHRPELLEYMNELDTRGRCKLELTPLYRRYSYIARLAMQAS